MNGKLAEQPQQVHKTLKGKKNLGEASFGHLQTLLYVAQDEESL